MGFNSHLTVSASASPETGAETGGNLVSLTPSLRKILDNEPYVVSYSLEAAMPAILKTPSDFKGVYFKALDGEEERAFIRRNLVGGTVPDFSRVQGRPTVRLVWWCPSRLPVSSVLNRAAKWTCISFPTE